VSFSSAFLSPGLAAMLGPVSVLSSLFLHCRLHQLSPLPSISCSRPHLSVFVVVVTFTFHFLYNCLLRETLSDYISIVIMYIESHLKCCVKKRQPTLSTLSIEKNKDTTFGFGLLECSMHVCAYWPCLSSRNKNNDDCSSWCFCNNCSRLGFYYISIY